MTHAMYDIRVFQSPAGEISEDGCWVATEGGWLYMADSREELLELVGKEWRDDRHLGM